MLCYGKDTQHAWEIFLFEQSAGTQKRMLVAELYSIQSFYQLSN